MRNFPYQEEDLLDSTDFIKLCIKRKYLINQSFLSFLNKKGFISPLSKIRNNHNSIIEYYSVFQFHLIKEIIDKRYDEYFYRTYLTYNLNSERFFKETMDSFESFDKSYEKTIYPKFVSFFELYYQIKKEYLIFQDIYIERLYQVADLGNDGNIGHKVNRLHMGGKIRLNLINKEVKKNKGKGDIKKNQEIIDFFLYRYLIKYEKHINLYEVLRTNKHFREIADFLIVLDFIEKILIVIEWYYEINSIPFHRKVTGVLINVDCTCIICGNLFLKRKSTQKTCGKEHCVIRNKYNLKQKTRKIDKDYGA